MKPRKTTKAPIKLAAEVVEITQLKMGRRRYYQTTLEFGSVCARITIPGKPWPLGTVVEFTEAMNS